MFRSSERYVPAASVECTRLDDATVLTAIHTGEKLSLTPTGAEVWMMLQSERRTVDRLVMGLAHRNLPVHGVQFHPESIASEHGHMILKNFLDIAASWNAATVRRNGQAAH